MARIDDDEDEDIDDDDDRKDDILRQIEEVEIEEEQDEDNKIDKRIAPQLRIHAHTSSHKRTQEEAIKERDRMLQGMSAGMSALSASTLNASTTMLSNDSPDGTGGGITDYASTGGITDYASQTTTQITPVGSKQNTPITANMKNIPSQQKSNKKVLWSDQRRKYQQDNSYQNNKTSDNFPSIRKMMSNGSEYWFDIERTIERKFESISFPNSRGKDMTALASYVFNEPEKYQKDILMHKDSNGVTSVTYPSNGPIKSNTTPSGHNNNNSNNNNTPKIRMSESFTNERRSFDVTLNRMSTAKTFVMKSIDETNVLPEQQQHYSYTEDDDNDNDETENKYNRRSDDNKYNNHNMETRLNINKNKEIEQQHAKNEKILKTYLKKSKQTLFICTLLITMIFSAQKLCYLTFITLYILDFVGGKEFVGSWLITVYLVGNFLSRIFIVVVLRRYSPKNVLLVCQLLMLLNCIILLMVDWLHIGKPIDNKQSRRFTKIMLYIILFIAGLVSSPIYVVCYTFLNKIQKVTQFVSTIIKIGNAISNSISIILMSLIIYNFGIETFPYYICLILFMGLIIVIILNIKYLLFQQRLLSYSVKYS